MTRPLGFSTWFFLVVAAVHATWAVAILANGEPLDTTGLHDLNKIIGNTTSTACLALVASVLSILSMLTHHYSARWSLALLLPQQVMMIMAARTAATCIVRGQFANGVILPPMFILADQCHIFWIGLAHTELIVHVYIWDGFLAWIRGPTVISPAPAPTLPTDGA